MLTAAFDLAKHEERTVDGDLDSYHGPRDEVTPQAPVYSTLHQQ